jgi:CysZ protein
MNSVFSALVAALKTFFQPRMLALVLWPMLLATVIWVGVAVYFWGSWINQLTVMVQATPAQQWMEQGFFAVASHYLMTILLVLLLFPAIYVTALLITAVVAMPVMVSHVARRNYPELEMKNGGSVGGSVWNALVAILVYCAGWVLSIPLWLFSPLAFILPIALMAYLNQRLFRYDALSEHASPEEYEQMMERAMPRLYLLGAIAGLLQLVPVIGFFSPVYVGLAFIHLCLAELTALRQSGMGA